MRKSTNIASRSRGGRNGGNPPDETAKSHRTKVQYLSSMEALVRPRWVTKQVTEALADTPVVVVNGARQVGKTTLVREQDYLGSVEIVSFDDVAVRAAARTDPRGFLDRGVDTLVIDEAQLEPTIFRAIKADVDRDRRPGRFMLTGSSRLLSAPDMADSLVGRVDVIELAPFSQGELEGTREDFVDAAFSDPRLLIRTGRATRADIIGRICAGGFPEAVRRTQHRRNRWFELYMTTSVQKVVSELADIERLAEIPRLLRLCAARTSTELNVASISNELGIPARTGSAYLARLASAFLVGTTPAWSTNLSAKVARKPKVTIVDSGLAAYLTGANPETLRRDPNALGQLLETFVGNELHRQISWSESKPTMWHFRDRGGTEVDIILEAPSGEIIGIEVEATSSPTTADMAGLRFLRDRLGDRFRFGFLLCLAPEALRMGDRLAVLPVESLWAEHQS